jgi:hypothetical protein
MEICFSLKKLLLTSKDCWLSLFDFTNMPSTHVQEPLLYCSETLDF